MGRTITIRFWLLTETRKGRGMHNGSHVSRAWLLDIGYRIDGAGRRVDSDGNALFCPNGYLRIVGIFETIRTYLHIAFLGVHDYFLYGIHVLVFLQNVHLKHFPDMNLDWH